MISLSLFPLDTYAALVNGQDKTQFLKVCPALSGPVDEQLHEIPRFIDIGVEPEGIDYLNGKTGLFSYFHVL
jgi:hypothetical protein